MIQVVVLATPDTEYEVELPKGATSYTFRSRASGAFRFSDEAGKVATPTEPYLDYPSGGSFSTPGGALRAVSSGRKLYFATSAGADVTIEVCSWS